MHLDKSTASTSVRGNAIKNSIFDLISVLFLFQERFPY